MSNKQDDIEKKIDVSVEEALDEAIRQQAEAMMAEEAEIDLDISEGTPAVSETDALKEQEEKFLRLSADFANFKRRTEKEKLDIYKNANEKLILALLPVIDNMERALGHAEESSKEAFVSGVEMVFKNMMEVMSKEGLKVIEALDQPFDHNLHHAVMTEPKEGYDSDYVIGVLQKGYQLGEKVIRPAMVKVSE